MELQVARLWGECRLSRVECNSSWCLGDNAPAPTSPRRVICFFVFIIFLRAQRSKCLWVGVGMGQPLRIDGL